MKKNNVIVLHQRGARSHYLGLQRLCYEREVSLTYLELDLIRQFVLCLLARKSFSVLFKNILGLTSIVLGFKRGSLVVLGLAPFSWMIVFLPLLRCKKVFLHTSWPYWKGDFVPFKSSVFWSRCWDRFLYRYVEGIFCVTSEARSSLVKRYPDFSTRSWVVYHSVEDFWFHKCPQLPVEFDYVYVGRMVKEKGVGEIIRLAKLLPESSFLLVGDGPDLEVVANTAPSNISVVGRLNRKELRRKLLVSRVLLLPSRRAFNWVEAFGIVVVEATLSGCLVYASDHPGPSELATLINSVKVFPEGNYAGDVFEYLSSNVEDVGPDFEAANIFTAHNISKSWERLLND